MTYPNLTRPRRGADLVDSSDSMLAPLVVCTGWALRTLARRSTLRFRRFDPLDRGDVIGQSGVQAMNPCRIDGIDVRRWDGRVELRNLPPHPSIIASR